MNIQINTHESHSIAKLLCDLFHLSKFLWLFNSYLSHIVSSGKPCHIPIHIAKQLLMIAKSIYIQLYKFRLSIKTEKLILLSGKTFMSK